MASIPREKEVARLWLEGRSVHDIAVAVGVEPSTVAVHLRRLNQAWKRSPVRKAVQLAKLDEVERKANAEWHRSRRKSRSVRRTYERQAAPPAAPDDDEGVDPFADPPAAQESVLVSEVVEEQERCGDPAYLRLVKECVVERLKLLGAYDVDARVSFTPEQVFAVIDATMRAVEAEGVGRELVDRIKRRTLTMLPRVDAGGMCETSSPAVVADDASLSAPSEYDESAQPEPPDRPPEISDFGEI